MAIDLSLFSILHECQMHHDQWQLEIYPKKNSCNIGRHPYIWGFRTMVSAKKNLKSNPLMTKFPMHLLSSVYHLQPWNICTLSLGHWDMWLHPKKHCAPKILWSTWPTHLFISSDFYVAPIFPYPQISMLHQDVFQMFPISALYFPIPFDTIWLFNIAMENHHFIHF